MGLATFFLYRLQIRQIQVIGLCGIFRGQGIYLIDGGRDAQFLSPLTDGESCLLHLHIILESDGSGYLEIGESVDLRLAQQIEKLRGLEVLYQF